ncbi:phosphatase PAP2 family protein [Streptomyces sp. LaPpAH-108]|uniref:phosphatase PAP2 family protein n=1 Tax=Streptomyces sp. LaPpAH-108 TaxID=1155714 RepID=UPI0003785443|nr:phosphatase PAP2 family protein [Streptomyces sp. LaPpAH-108]
MPGSPAAGVSFGRDRAVWWCVCAAAAFAGLTAAVLAVDGGPIASDAALRRGARENRPAPVVTVLRAVTTTGTGITPYAVALSAGLIAAPALDAVRDRHTAIRFALPALVFAAWLALGQALRFALMTAIARPRPPAEDWLTHASRWSFPSGHTTTSAMTAGLLVLALLVRRPPAYRLWTALTVVWAVAVGVGRVWLGVHWASDVVAGWLLATAWTLMAVVVAARVTAPRPDGAA